MSTMSRVDRLLCMAGPLTEVLFDNDPGMAERAGGLILPNLVQVEDLYGSRLTRARYEVGVDDRGRLESLHIVQDPPTDGGYHDSSNDIHLERQWRGSGGYVETVTTTAGKQLTSRTVAMGATNCMVMVSGRGATAAASYNIRRQGHNRRAAVSSISPMEGGITTGWLVARDAHGRVSRETKTLIDLTGNPNEIGRRNYLYNRDGQLATIQTEGMLDGDLTNLVHVQYPADNLVVVTGYIQDRASDTAQLLWEETRRYGKSQLVERIMRSSFETSETRTRLVNISYPVAATGAVA